MIRLFCAWSELGWNVIAMEGLSAFTEEIILEWADLADNLSVHQIPKSDGCQEEQE